MLFGFIRTGFIDGLKALVKGGVIQKAKFFSCFRGGIALLDKRLCVLHSLEFDILF